MKKVQETKKLTLEEYQERYTSRENVEAAKTFLFILGAAIGLIIVTSLFFVVLRLFEIHNIAGYVGVVAAVLIFIFLYLVPVVKLSKTKSFQTNIKTTTAKKAKRHNKILREEIADKMIDVTIKTEGVGWYSDKQVARLAVARQRRNDQALKDALTEIYQTDVKTAANKLIRKAAVRVGITTAVSQSEHIDTLFVLVYDLKLIKDIVYLYGYRPSDTKMVKIYKTVISNALIAYGLSTGTTSLGKTFGSGIVSMIDKASNSMNPLTSTFGSVVGGIAGTALESSLQFIVNSTFTTLIGYQTKKYLSKEYNLQDILDNVELVETPDEQVKMIESIKDEVRENLVKKHKKEKIKPAT